MAELAVHNRKREQVGQCELPDAVYAYPLKTHLMYEAVRHYLAVARRGTHKTKNRIEVRGGGRKPWKQKGTGRARVGSTRSPIWRKGGVVFGPAPRDYSYDFPKKARRRALASALSEKVRRDLLLIVDDLAMDSHKTKDLVALRASIGVEGKVLFVFDGENENMTLAARNHPQISAVRALQTHAYHVLDHETVVVSRAAAEALGEVLSR